MNRLVEAALVFLASLIAGVPLIQFLWAWNIRKYKFFADCSEHIATQVGSRRILLPIMSASALLILPFSYSPENFAVCIFIVCVCMGTLLRWATPPSVLLLGASGATANELLPMMPVIFPAKLIHLLRDNYDDPDRGYDLKLHTLFTNSRASGPLTWQKAVIRYLSICDRVIIDMRTGSGHLDEELTMIAASSARIQAKILYLIDKDQFARDPKAYRQYAGKLCTSVREAVRRLRRQR